MHVLWHSSSLGISLLLSRRCMCLTRTLHLTAAAAATQDTLARCVCFWLRRFYTAAVAFWLMLSFPTCRLLCPADHSPSFARHSSGVQFRPLPPSAACATAADGVCITNNDCLSSATQMTPSATLRLTDDDCSDDATLRVLHRRISSQNQ